MKSAALVVVALGLLLAMASPSLAHEHRGCAPVRHYHYGYSGGYYYGGVAPVVVAPAPVYGYAAYPPVVSPAVAPVVTPVVPYYYGAPGVSLGYRGRGVAVGVHF